VVVVVEAMVAMIEMDGAVVEEVRFLIFIVTYSHLVFKIEYIN